MPKSAPGRIRTYDPRIRSPMLYPAELGARTVAIQVTGERAVKRNRETRPTCCLFPQAARSVAFDYGWLRERSAGEVEAADPRALAALDRAARDLAK